MSTNFLCSNTRYLDVPYEMREEAKNIDAVSYLTKSNGPVVSVMITIMMICLDF